MTRFARVALISCCLLPVAACAPPPEPPPPEVVAQGLTEALLDTGRYRTVQLTRDIGMHHNPGDDAWTLIVCFDFTAFDVAAGGEIEGTNCIDSALARQLTNGSWVIGVTIDEVYRWRAIPAVSAAAAETSAPSS